MQTLHTKSGQIATTFSDALHAVLDAYQSLGEQIPLLEGYQQLFTSNAHMRTVLGLIYQDILEFHREAIKHFKQRCKFSRNRHQEGHANILSLVWKQLFQATWRGFTVKIEHLKENLRRHKQLIESHATIVQFEEVQRLRDDAKRNFKSHQAAEKDRRRLRIMQWLSPFNNENLQDQYRETRSICGNAGHWLLNDLRFQRWFSSSQCLSPLLWLNGIPGAGMLIIHPKNLSLTKIVGKTILASAIVDQARSVAKTSTAFFYCKYGDPSRNTFVSVARSLLAQLLAQNDHLLQILYEKASTSGEIMLTSKANARDLLHIALSSCGTTYVILDGIDECDRNDRKDIATWFQSVVAQLNLGSQEIIRCLFISQDDGIARKDLSTIPSIKIMPSDTKDDLGAFARFWHARIEDKFGKLQNSMHIANILYARAQGKNFS